MIGTIRGSLVMIASASCSGSLSHSDASTHRDPCTCFTRAARALCEPRRCAIQFESGGSRLENQWGILCACRSGEVQHESDWEGSIPMRFIQLQNLSNQDLKIYKYKERFCSFQNPSSSSSATTTIRHLNQRIVVANINLVDPYGRLTKPTKWEHHNSDCN